MGGSKVVNVIANVLYSMFFFSFPRLLLNMTVFIADRALGEWMALARNAVCEEIELPYLVKTPIHKRLRRVKFFWSTSKEHIND